MFELKKVTKRFGRTVALHPCDFSLKLGETVALIGPSGSGKSTLLRIMAGLVLPDSGTLAHDDNPISPKDWGLVRRRMGYVIQDGGLFPHMTALANVTLMARHLRWDKAKIEARVEELRALVQLDPSQLARLPGALSGGQRQRVSLMRALMLNPEVLLLDEPLSALDPITRYELAQELKDIFARLNKAVVLVTHALNEARFFAHRIVLMREGHIVQEGTLDDFIQAPNDPFVSRFLEAERELG